MYTINRRGLILSIVLSSLALLPASVAHAQWVEDELEQAETPVEIELSVGTGAIAEAQARVVSVGPPVISVPATVGSCFARGVTPASSEGDWYTAYADAGLVIRRVCNWNGYGPPSTITWDDNWAWSKNFGTEPSLSWFSGDVTVTFGNTTVESISGFLQNVGCANTGSRTFTLSGSLHSHALVDNSFDASVEATAVAFRWFELR